MGYYPVFLNLEKSPCVVIGEGLEAERKVQGLIEAGALVTVITPNPSQSLEELEAQGKITLRKEKFSEGDLAGAFLAIAATTEDLEISERIAREAEREGVLLNVIDITHLCTWIAPAIVRRGKLTVAISTSGLSPAMARFVKEEIERALPRKYETLLEVLAEVRKNLRRRNTRPHPDKWQKALTEIANNDLEEGDWKAIKLYLMELLRPQRRHLGSRSE